MRTINIPKEKDQPSLLEYKRILNELKHQGVRFIEPGKTYQADSGEVNFNHPLVFSDDTTWYVVGNEIGHGRYGSVHRITHKITLGSTPEIFNHISRPLVLKKQLLSSNKPIEGQVRKIKQEVDYLKRQQIHVHAQFQSSDTVYLIMDDCGQSMRSCMRDHANATLCERLVFALSILNEVNFLQQNNIVHCDIKPANICVKEVKATAKTPKRHQFFLIDFGLSHSNNEGTNGSRLGSPTYISPEVVSHNDNATYQFSRDLYALAGVLGELFGCDYNDLAYFKKIRIEKTGSRISASTVPYDFSTLLAGVDTNGLGETFKRDLLQLLLELSDPDPMKRPSLEVVIKFFLHTLSTLNHTPQGVYNANSYIYPLEKVSYYEGVKAICAINVGDDGYNIQQESQLLSEVIPRNRSIDSEINIILSLAGINLAVYSSSKLSEEVKQAILILDFNKLSIIDNWELLKKESFQRALIIANQSGVNVKDNWELLKKESFQRALIIANQAGVNVKDNWELLKKESFQRALIIANQAGVNVKDNSELLKKESFQRALIIANQAGVNVKDNWELLKNESLQSTISSASESIESIPTDRAVDKQFKSACLTLQNSLVKNVITSVGACERRGVSFDYTKHYASRQIMKLDGIVQTVMSTSNNDSDKIEALKNYENQAKKHSSGWVKFGKSIAGVLITGAGVVLGALAGAALGGAALSFTGPGAIVGAVLGAWKGASIGASVGGAIAAGASCMFFRRKSKEEKLSKDIVQTGRETLRNRSAR